MRDYSQNKEGILLKELFDKIGTESRYAVEFGAGDGVSLSNIKGLVELGWEGLQMEGIVEPTSNVKEEFITKDNINDLFKKYNVPHNVDLVSIDIDGNDYWVWKELNYAPNVVIIEYNSNFALGENYALIYNEKHVFDGFYSASISAYIELAKAKGYFLYREVNFCNLVFVKDKFKGIVDELNPAILDLPKAHHGGKQLNRFTKV